MEVKAKLSNLRIAPRKTRLVADAIRYKTASDAEAILSFTVKKSAPAMLKLLNSAIFNAKNNFQIEKDNLFISKITVDEGVKLKRWMPRSRGRAAEITKRTSHITITLKEIKESGKKAVKAKTTKKVGKTVETSEVVETEEKEVKIGKKKSYRSDRRLMRQNKPGKTVTSNKIYRRKSV